MEKNIDNRKTMQKIWKAQIKISAWKTTMAERKIGSGGKPAHRPNFRRRFGLLSVLVYGGAKRRHLYI